MCSSDLYGRVDILVHSASVGWSWQEKSPGAMDPLATTTPEKWVEVIGFNLNAAAFIDRACLNQMLKQGKGSIVNVASIFGLGGAPDAHTYTATKGAIINLSRSMSVAYVDDHIRVNVVAPGFVTTQMVESVLPKGWMCPEEEFYVNPNRQSRTMRKYFTGFLSPFLNWTAMDSVHKIRYVTAHPAMASAKILATVAGFEMWNNKIGRAHV